MVGGIAIQLAAMIAFCICVFDFLRRRGFSFSNTLAHDASNQGERLSWLCLGIIWTATWILVRCVYRLVELSQVSPFRTRAKNSALNDIGGRAGMATL